MDIVDPRIDPRLVPKGSIARVINSKDRDYLDLPSVVTPGGQVITRWTPSDNERRRLLEGEDLYITLLTNGPINPLFLTVGPVDWSKNEV